MLSLARSLWILGYFIYFVALIIITKVRNYEMFVACGNSRFIYSNVPHFTVSNGAVTLETVIIKITLYWKK